MGSALLTPHHGPLLIAADDVHDVFEPNLWGHSVHGWATVVVAESVESALVPQGIVEDVIPGGLEPEPAVLKRPIGEIGRKASKVCVTCVEEILPVSVLTNVGWSDGISGQSHLSEEVGMQPQQPIFGHVNHDKKAVRNPVKPTCVNLDAAAGMKPDGGLETILTHDGGQPVHDPTPCLVVAPFDWGCACLAARTLTWKLDIV